MQEKESLNIVGDQWGSPASSSMLADVTLKIVDAIIKNKNFTILYLKIRFIYLQLNCIKQR
jgi:dTDP-4-dehydrorhamnose reductase